MSRFVFTVAPGAEIRIGAFGLATNDAPAIVPDLVAEGLGGCPDLFVSSGPAEEQPPPRRTKTAPAPDAISPAKGKEK